MEKEKTKANKEESEEIKCLKGKIEKLQREKIFYQILIEQLSEKGNEK